MIPLAGFLTFVLYVAIVLIRTMDPTSKTINASYITYLGVFLMLIGLTMVNVANASNHVLIPLNVLIYLELLLSVTYKRTQELASESTVIYINGLYMVIAPYLLIVPVLTLVGGIYILCTS